MWLGGLSSLSHSSVKSRTKEPHRIVKSLDYADLFLHLFYDRASPLRILP